LQRRFKCEFAVKIANYLHGPLVLGPRYCNCRLQVAAIYELHF